MIVDVAALILWTAVTAYAVFGGADYGAGFWSLAAPGARGARPRALIKHAVGPVWEVNHVWLVYSLILLWTAFPPAYESIMSTMFTPLTMAVIGIVLRGSAYAFGGASASPRAIRIWMLVYGLSSVVTPFLLGAVLGGIASGRVPVGNAAGQSFDAWMNPTSVVVGLFAVVSGAYLAAVFLTADARRYGDVPLEGYFRRRAIAAAWAAGFLAVVGFFVLGDDAPYIHHGMTHAALPLVILSALAGMAALILLRRGGRRFARLLAVGAFASVVWGWGVAQYPYILPTTLTLDRAAGNSHTLQWVVVAILLASVTVFPLLGLLFFLHERGKLEDGMEPAGDGPRHRVVIVGGGFGGLPAARMLGLSQVQVTLLDRRNHHLFQPLLYQVATGILSPGDIAAPLRHILRRHKNVTVELSEVTGFDLERRVVRASRFFEPPLEVPYDSLIVAAGAGQSYFGHDEFALYAPGMKTIDDALEIRRRVFGALEAGEIAEDPAERQLWMTIVVVGAGPTGVELAGQIRELAVRSVKEDFRRIDPASLRVLLVDAGAEPLATFGDRLSSKAAHSLEALGVELRMGARVTGIDGSGVDLEGKGGKERIATRTVIWAAGVQASPLAKELAGATGAQVDRAGRIEVLPDLTLPGHPEVFVAGDMMALDDLPGVSEVAMQGGLHSAHTILRRLRGDNEEVPFRYRDLGSMATIGRFRAVASVGRLRLSGFGAWLLWIGVHLAFLNSFSNRFSALARWAGSMIGRQRHERTFSVGRTAGDVSLPEAVRAAIMPDRFPAAKESLNAHGSSAEASSPARGDPSPAGARPPPAEGPR